MDFGNFVLVLVFDSVISNGLGILLFIWVFEIYKYIYNIFIISLEMFVKWG